MLISAITSNQPKPTTSPKLMQTTNTISTEMKHSTFSSASPAVSIPTNLPRTPIVTRKTNPQAQYLDSLNYTEIATTSTSRLSELLTASETAIYKTITGSLRSRPTASTTQITPLDMNTVTLSNTAFQKFKMISLAKEQRLTTEVGSNFGQVANSTIYLISKVTKRLKMTTNLSSSQAILSRTSIQLTSRPDVHTLSRHTTTTATTLSATPSTENPTIATASETIYITIKPFKTITSSMSATKRSESTLLIPALLPKTNNISTLPKKKTFASSNFSEERTLSPTSSRWSNSHTLLPSTFKQSNNTIVFMRETSTDNMSLGICNNKSCVMENNAELSFENNGLAKGLLSSGAVIALGAVTGVVYITMCKKVKISPGSKE